MTERLNPASPVVLRRELVRAKALVGAGGAIPKAHARPAVVQKLNAGGF